MKGSAKANKLFRNFFLWIRSKEFLVFLFFFIVSGFFWVTQAIKEPAEMEVDVIVKLVGKPKKVKVIDKKNWADTLKVTVRDKGYNLLGYYFDKVNPIEVRFASYAKEDGKIVVPNSEIVKLLKRRLKRSTEIVVVKPDKLEASYNYGESKKVKVVLNGELKEADRYFIVNTRIIPDSVEIFAMQSQLAGIDSVMTQQLKIPPISESMTRKLYLQKINDVGFETNMVTLEVKVDVRKDASIEVPIIPINVPDSITLHFQPSVVSVSYVIGSSNLEAIRPEDFEVVGDYKDIDSVDTDKITLKLRRYPVLVKRPRLANESVEYSIEKH